MQATLPPGWGALQMSESLTAGEVPLPENVTLAVDPASVLLTIKAPRGMTKAEASATQEGGEGEGEDDAEGAEDAGA